MIYNDQVLNKRQGTQRNLWSRGRGKELKRETVAEVGTST